MALYFQNNLLSWTGLTWLVGPLVRATCTVQDRIECTSKEYLRAYCPNLKLVNNFRGSCFGMRLFGMKSFILNVLTLHTTLTYTLFSKISSQCPIMWACISLAIKLNRQEVKFVSKWSSRGWSEGVINHVCCNNFGRSKFDLGSWIWAKLWLVPR